MPRSKFSVLRSNNRPSFTVYADTDIVPVMLDVNMAIGLGHILTSIKHNDPRYEALGRKLLAIEKQLDDDGDDSDFGDDDNE